ncbi:hypothetical protein A7985_14675 [Pseudoalteromonas luteoviolacea]|uniref:Carrier domain-containing protein n=1 Tax=Pseudoalteromonas luteoviolacea TaxID=43657 RepID=A0A1C0TQ86_9GAMM|nr:non-ribosomal peptide synthetase [Pseudoalteromonas luteoviolacea]OCQ21025.1 hypothetical protein A7985_14675 [Pseudoalteromonas luteoviolacea]
MSKNSQNQHLLEKIITNAQVYADKPAIVDGERVLTYRDLHLASQHLAKTLQQLPVSGNISAIPIIAERSIEFIVAVLACWKVGCAYLPISHGTPDDRVNFILQESACPFLLNGTSADTEAMHEALLNWQLDTSDIELDEQVLSEEQLAYVIYTSGTTGKPKGCSIGFDSFSPIASTVVEQFELSEKSHTTVVASCAFDASAFEIWPALSAGATLHIVDQTSLVNPIRLSAFFNNHEITFSWLPTPIAEVLMKNPQLQLPNCLKTIVTAGQRLTVRPPKEWSTVVVNAYGPTETTIIATSSVVSSQGDSLPDIGKPIAGVSTFILNEHRLPVKPGETGELYVAGAGVCRGYVNRSELTTAKFVTLENLCESPVKAYATGDLCRVNHFGALEFMGRVDEQIKLHGYRIEPGEIEYYLGKFDNVLQVAVSLQTLPTGNALVAHYVAQGDKDINTGEVSEFLSQFVPSYFLPSHYLRLENMPLTANGKVDKKALPEFKIEHSFELEPNLTPEQSQFLNIFNQFCTNPLNWNDDCFAKGFNSIAIIQLVQHVQQSLSLQLMFEDVYRHKTPCQIWQHIQRPAHALTNILARPDEFAKTAPLSSTQRAIWFITSFAPEDRAYHAKSVVKFTGKLNKKALQSALQDIVDHHEIYRTSFDRKQTVQNIHAEMEVVLGEFDFSGFSADVAEAKFDTLVADTLNQPFNIEQLPLVRWALVKLSEEHFGLIHIEHHLVHDGWSYNVFLKQLFQSYQQHVNGADNVVIDGGMQYADYSVTQQQWLDTDDAAMQKSYWVEQLKDAPSAINFPQIASEEETDAGRSIRSSMKRETWNQINDYCQKKSVTPFSFMLAALNIVLSRYTGDTDICTGVGLANRNWGQSENVIGMLVNTIVLRVKQSKELTISEFVQQCFDVTMAGQNNQEYPFELIVDEINPPRPENRNPIFQVCLGFHDSPVPEMDLKDIENIHITEAIDSKSAKFDLNLVLIPREGQLNGDDLTLIWEFNLSHLSSWFVDNMMMSFQSVVQQILSAEDDTRLSAFHIHSEQQTSQIIDSLSRGADSQSSSNMLRELVEAQASENPDKIALICEENKVSYGQLNAQANQLAYKVKASYMAQFGQELRPDTFVALYFDRNIDMVVSMLAVLKAGAAYVPIAPKYPSNRARYILEDTKASIVLTQTSYLSTVEEWCQELDWIAEIIAIDGESSLNEMPTHNPAQVNMPADIAYVIYTSGTTGRPKGVLVQNNNIVALLRANNFATSTLTSSLWTDYVFDVSAYEIYSALTSGGELHIIPESMRFTPELYLAYVEEHQIEKCYMPPAYMKALSKLVSEGKLPSIKHVLTGVEKISSVYVDSFLSNNVTLINAYGPTETTTCSTSLLCTQDVNKYTSIPIGRPNDNEQCYVLGEHNTLCPIGVPGELFIGGAGVTRGYLNQSEETASRFIENPFMSEQDKANGFTRLYKTGDKVRWLADGNLEFLGRNDSQVKVRGFRIELSEIESVLTEMREIDQVKVLDWQKDSTTYLVAYIERKQTENLSQSEIRRRLALELPDYMTPDSIMFIDAIPMTNNGKLDREKLPTPVFSEANYFQALETFEEHLIAKVWGDVLGIEWHEISKQDSFFALGGHSLLIIQCKTRLFQLGYDLPTNTLYGTASLSEIALQLAISEDELAPETNIPPDVEMLTPDMFSMADLDASQLSKIESQIAGGIANIQDIYPLAPIQTGMLYHALQATDRDPYIVKTVFECESARWCQKLLEGFQFLISRHDILRTQIVVEGLEQPMQVVHRNAQLSVEEIILDDNLSEAQLLSYLRAFELTDASALSINSTPLLLAKIVKYKDRNFVVTFHHHMVIDDLTQRVFQTELKEYMLRRSEELPEAVPYRDFIWHMLNLDTSDAEAYFAERLAGYDQPTRPFFVELDDKMEDEANHFSSILRGGIPEKIKSLAQSNNVSISAVLHLAWSIVLSRCSDQSDVVFGTVLSGRMHSVNNMERITGPCINTLPLRISFKQQSLPLLLKDVHDSLSNLMLFEQTPLASIQAQSDIENGKPLFNTVLNCRMLMQNDDKSMAQSDTYQVIKPLWGSGRVHYPVFMTINTSEDTFLFNIDSHSSIEPEHLYQYMVHTLNFLLELDSKQSDEFALRQFSLLGDGEIAQLMAWNDTREPVPATTLRALFEEQASITPDDIALVYEQQSLSYAQLNAQANRLAYKIKAVYTAQTGNEMHPETLVGLYLDKSIEMIVSMLAVLKAGGAYVPIAPKYPNNRTRYILEDTSASIVLTQENHLSTIRGMCGERSDSIELIAVDCDESYREMPTHNPQNINTSEDLTYVFYTSGTTGRPKGVQIQNSNIVSHIHCSRMETPLLRASMWVDYVFDVSCLELYPALTRGEELHIVPESQRLTPESFVAFMKQYDIEKCYAPPAYMKVLSDAIYTNKLPSLKHISTGVEKIPTSYVENILSRDDITVVNYYGPTEATTFSSSLVVDDSVRQYTALPIGTPHENEQCFVLDSQGMLCPIGVPGELFIAGEGVARGYLNMPEETASRFVNNPFATEEDKAKGLIRMYKTGDKARWLHDGNLEFLGRNDSQVKIRGHRIELTEIESVLGEIDSVSQAAVIDFTHDNQIYLAAYLIGAEGHSLDIEKLDSELRQLLPDYMIPATFIEIESIPLTINGKLNKPQLPTPTLDSRATYVGPRNDFEQRLCDVWEKVLNRREIGVYDNYFNIGGNSLKAMKIATLSKEIAGIEIPLEVLLKHATIAGIASALESAVTATVIEATGNKGNASSERTKTWI